MTKYIKTKRLRKGLFLSSSSPLPPSDFYSTSTACDGSGSVSFYVADGDNPVIAGTPLFIDDMLTVPAVGISYILSNTLYSTDINGLVNAEYSPCYNILNAYDSCSTATPLLLYYALEEVLQPGTTIYIDANLTTPFSSDVFVSEGTVYVTDSLGVVVNQYPCLSEATVYLDCSSYNSGSGSFTVYATNGGVIDSMVYVTYDPEGTSPYTGGLVFNGTYFSTDSFGQATLVETCPTP